MHTSKFTIDGEEVLVHHNGDWSGEVIVMWGRKEVPRFEVEGDPKKPLMQRPISPRVTFEHEVKLPGKLLIALARGAAVRFIGGKVLSLMEQLDDDEMKPSPDFKSAEERDAWLREELRKDVERMGR